MNVMIILIFLILSLLTLIKKTQFNKRFHLYITIIFVLTMLLVSVIITYLIIKFK